MEKIDQYLEKYFEEKKEKNPDKWDERIEPLLKEMFQRRQEVLSLSDEEQKKEIESFFENIDYIEVVEKSEDLEINAEATGVCVFKDRKIQINAEYYRNLQEQGNLDTSSVNQWYLQNFFHECNHAIAEKNFSNQGLQHREWLKWEGSALEEAITERTSTLMAYKESKEDVDNHKISTYSYNNITFISPALAAAFGVDEKEMIQQARSGGIDAMNKYLLSNFDNKEQGEEYLENIYDNLDNLYNKTCSLYKEKDADNSENADYMNNIVTNLKKVQNERLSQDKDDITDFDAYIENEKYNNNRLDTILEDAIKINSQYFKSQDDTNTLNNTLKSFSKVSKTKIDTLDIVNQNKGKFTDEAFKDIVNSVSKNPIIWNSTDGKYRSNDYETNMALSGIDFSQVGKNEGKYEISEDKKQREYEKYYKNGEQWDNSSLWTKIEEIIKEPKQINKSSVIDSIKKVWEEITGEKEVETGNQYASKQSTIDVFKNAISSNKIEDNKNNNSVKDERII